MRGGAYGLGSLAGRMFWLMSAGVRYTVRNRPLAWTPTLVRAAGMAGRRECVETFALSPRTDDPGRYKVICSLAGSFGDAQRQGAGIGALTSGPAFSGRTKVA
jgi:hypothetical protein